MISCTLVLTFLMQTYYLLTLLKGVSVLGCLFNTGIATKETMDLLSSPIRSKDVVETNGTLYQTEDVSLEGILPISDNEGESTVSITVVGASGDLAKKKIFPALFALYYEGCLPKVTNMLIY